MATKPETKVTQAIIARIKLWGGSAYHVHGSIMQRGGEPDISGEIRAANGGWLHIKIEVKTPTGIPSKRQIDRLKYYWETGYLVGIVTSVDEFTGLVSIYKNWQFFSADNHFLSFVSQRGFRLPYTELYFAKHND